MGPVHGPHSAYSRAGINVAAHRDIECVWSQRAALARARRIILPAAGQKDARLAAVSPATQFREASKEELAPTWQEPRNSSVRAQAMQNGAANLSSTAGAGVTRCDYQSIDEKRQSNCS